MIADDLFVGWLSKVRKMTDPMEGVEDFIKRLETSELRPLFNMNDPDEMRSYLEKDRDPGFWHELLLYANWDTPIPTEAAKWMLQQDDCENAIAVLILCQISFDHMINPGPRMVSDPDSDELAQMIIERDQGRGFPSSNLADSQMVSRSSLLERCLNAELAAREAGVEPRFKTPLKTLQTTPQGPLPQTSYMIDECSVSAFVPFQSI